MTAKFGALSATGKRSWICGECGRRITRSKRFRQTVNPWNTNPDGSVKSRAEVQADVQADADAWSAAPPSPSNSCQTHNRARNTASHWVDQIFSVSC